MPAGARGGAGCYDVRARCRHAQPHAAKVRQQHVPRVLCARAAMTAGSPGEAGRRAARLTPCPAEQAPKLLADLAHDRRVDDGGHLFDIVEQRAVEQRLVAVLEALEEEVLVHVGLTGPEALQDLFLLHVHAQLAGRHEPPDVQAVALRQAERGALVHDRVVHDAKATTASEVRRAPVVRVRVDDDGAVRHVSHRGSPARRRCAQCRRASRRGAHPGHPAGCSCEHRKGKVSPWRGAGGGVRTCSWSVVMRRTPLPQLAECYDTPRGTVARDCSHLSF